MRILVLLLAVLFGPGPVHARDIAGQFDYYILALSWQPGWCRSTGDDRAAPECSDGTGRGFTVHGLWPQNERGWPRDCATDERDPSRRESQAMDDIMGSGGLAWHQWKKHGRCSGLSASAYYDTTREALARITVPRVLDRLDRDITLDPALVEEAFLEANPDLAADGVTITCRDRSLAEVRICLTRDLHPRDCAPDARSDCSRPRVLMEAVR
jgi:ribonuclease T2